MSQTTSNAANGIAPGRLSAEQLGCNFADVAPPLSANAAVIAADRCHYCYDAPCVNACPTGIDIPGFISKIGNGNLKGAARDILSANPLGGMCARVCPTEILCEGACVRNHQDGEPVQIGALQRHATDFQMVREAAGAPALFKRASETGRHVAVVGAGPAGLACAHTLALAGHRVSVFDAREHPGGLNEYGIAAYKTVDDYAQREVRWLLSVGGIELRQGQRLGHDVTLAELRAAYDAVFIGVGLGGTHTLSIEGELLDGVLDAVNFIARVREADDLASVPVGRKVVVLGGGNTAIDAAVQSRKLGAEQVTLAYRRGAAQMSATWAELEFARSQGVTLAEWMKPLRFVGDTQVRAVEFERTGLDMSGALRGTGEIVRVEADMVLKAIGQTLLPEGLDGLQLTEEGGRVAVDANGATSLAGVFAGGDCAGHGATDLTVQAVQDGKLAAHAIDRFLASQSAKAARAA
ncbi:glutamate synthase (NADPH/NADH) small chain [Paraburkholderia sp. HC6.4b]|uniref:NAD(P)-dependent oxidoreductase n=1 Tax=unclassified Paraburkholderia TaxID=2615204 RepID=UPI001608C942|nr:MULTISPECIES: NAD(P)-dependent oxidoreductase [unclassified Paraburkholderia]MBB5407492.1 glutamate synthase (NADPH/NADH) small chain [Paraburkholderia sp. HC6.4b]MBB5453751.1 glutamate synthase (NADPH/NADH) small chain [Paraburkholderia sp. Kb1A]